MLFSTSLKFFGVALLLPAVLAAPSSEPRKTRRITLTGKIGGASQASSNPDDGEIVFPEHTIREQTSKSDTYGVLYGGWKTNEDDNGVPAIATVMNDLNYNGRLDETLPYLLAYGQAAEDGSLWFIYPRD